MKYEEYVWLVSDSFKYYDFVYTFYYRIFATLLFTFEISFP